MSDNKTHQSIPGAGMSLAPWRTWLQPGESTLEKHRQGVLVVDRLTRREDNEQVQR